MKVIEKSIAENEKEITRREKGEGGVRRLPNNKYEVRFRSKGIDITKVCPTYDDAKKLAKELRNKVISKEISPCNAQLSDYMKEWLFLFKKPKVRPQTFDRLESTFNFQFCGSKLSRMQLRNVVLKDIQKHINDISLKYSYSTVKKTFQLLNACLEHAVNAGDLYRNPMKAAICPSEKNCSIKTKEIKVFSKDEESKFLENAIRVAENQMCIYRYGQAFVILFNTGIRSGEMIGLEWTQVDLEKGIIYIKKTDTSYKNRNINKKDTRKYIRELDDVKTDASNRKIELSDDAKEAFRKIKEYQTKEGLKTRFVLSTKTGRMVTHNNLQKVMNAIMKVSGIDAKNYSLHATRHTFATKMLRNGTDINIVRKILGHRDIKVTYDIYIHIDDEELKEALYKVYNN